MGDPNDSLDELIICSFRVERIDWVSDIGLAIPCCYRAPTSYLISPASPICQLCSLCVNPRYIKVR